MADRKRRVAIVVTGGSKGIGRAIVTAFAEGGRAVVVNHHTDDAAAGDAVDAVRSAGGAPVLVRADAGTPAGCTEIARAVRDAGERCEMAVHSAVDVYVTDVMSADPGRFARAVTTNGTSLLFLVRALGDPLDRGSTVFHLTSRGGRIVVPGHAPIGVGKALAEGLMRYGATELAPRDIRLDAIAPFIVETEAVQRIFGERTTDLMDHARRGNPSGGAVEARDHCELIRFLASPAAEFATGQVMFANGGANLAA